MTPLAMAMRDEQPVSLARMVRVGWLCVLLLLGSQAIAATHVHDVETDALCLVCSHGGGSILGEVAAALDGPSVRIAPSPSAPVDEVLSRAPLTPHQPRAPPSP